MKYHSVRIVRCKSVRLKLLPTQPSLLQMSLTPPLQLFLLLLLSAPLYGCQKSLAFAVNSCANVDAQWCGRLEFSVCVDAIVNNHGGHCYQLLILVCQGTILAPKLRLQSGVSAVAELSGAVFPPFVDLTFPLAYFVSCYCSSTYSSITSQVMKIVGFDFHLTWQ